MIVDEKEFEKFFDQVQCRKVAVPSTGELISLPLVAKDGIMMAAIYLADRTKALETVIPEGLIPAKLPGDKTLIGFICIEYPTVRINNPETDIGIDPYNEFLIVFPGIIGDKSIKPPKLQKILKDEVPNLVYYIRHIGVNTRMAELAGNEFLGYNKFICDITFTEDDSMRKCVVENDGKMILSLTISPKPDNFELHRDQTSVASYKNFYGQKNFYKLTYQNQSKIDITTDPCAELTLGNHPLSKILSGLDISKKPIQVRYAPLFQLISDDKQLEIFDIPK